MQPDDLRAALESLGSDPAPSWGRADAIPGGWSYWTFAVEPNCIFRFPKTNEVADRLRKELRLLPELRECVSFEVPNPEWTGRHHGLPFMGYRRLPGRALAVGDLAVAGPAPAQKRADAREGLAQILAELHGFPKQRAGQLVQVRDGIGAWSRSYQELRARIGERVLPLLGEGLRRGVERATERFWTDGLSEFCHPVLVHGDLGGQHLLVDGETGKCQAMIDFETATLGDPAIDFIGLWIDHGPEATGDILARYGGPPDAGFGERLYFYHWMGSVHAILHGLETDDSTLVADAIARLEERLERPAIGDRLR